MILGTAGHIDHGKTALVQALTGVNTDRLPEEKRRGITVELGFAQLSLPGGRRLGVVDVPGHERFVRAMAAGAGGVDLVLLVVAVDGGVMPQTREHLDICRLLGVQKGVIAFTKADTLDALGPLGRDLLQSEVDELVAGSFLESAPRVYCSARTGEGMAELVRALEAVADSVAERSNEGPFFLPVDRAFSVKGFGTVLTGSVLSGTLAVEESVCLIPGPEASFRVRGLEAHNLPVLELGAGGRGAVNLAGLAVEEAQRGRVLCRAGELESTQTLDVELELLPSADGPLAKRRRLLLHLGTAQIPATVHLLEGKTLLPGSRALAELRLDLPTAALVGQRFILRGNQALQGRGATLAGGRILSVGRRRRKDGVEALRPLLVATADVQVRWLLRQAGFRGLGPVALRGRAGLGARTLESTLDTLLAEGEAVLCEGTPPLYLAGDALRQLGTRAEALLEQAHLRAPERAGLPQEELRRRLWEGLSPRVFARVLQRLVQEGKVELDGERVRRVGECRKLSGEAREQQSRALDALAKAGLAPPTVSELGGQLKVSPGRLLELLELAREDGTVEKVSQEFYVDATALQGLRHRLVEHLRAHGDISTQAFKDMTGQSRKFAIPLAEYFDREKVTLRIQDRRVLRKG